MTGVALVQETWKLSKFKNLKLMKDGTWFQQTLSTVLRIKVYYGFDQQTYDVCCTGIRDRIADIGIWPTFLGDLLSQKKWPKPARNFVWYQRRIYKKFVGFLPLFPMNIPVDVPFDPTILVWLKFPDVAAKVNLKIPRSKASKWGRIIFYPQVMG